MSACAGRAGGDEALRPEGRSGRGSPDVRAWAEGGLGGAPCAFHMERAVARTTLDIQHASAATWEQPDLGPSVDSLCRLGPKHG